MYTGSGLVDSVWNAIGVVVVFVCVLLIIFKFFVGAQKNIPAGIGALAGVALLAAIASNPQVLVDAGDTLAGLLGLRGA